MMPSIDTSYPEIWMIGDFITFGVSMDASGLSGVMNVVVMVSDFGGVMVSWGDEVDVVGVIVTAIPIMGVTTDDDGMMGMIGNNGIAIVDIEAPASVGYEEMEGMALDEVGVIGGEMGGIEGILT